MSASFDLLSRNWTANPSSENLDKLRQFCRRSGQILPISAIRASEPWLRIFQLLSGLATGQPTIEALSAAEFESIAASVDFVIPELVTHWLLLGGGPQLIGPETLLSSPQTLVQTGIVRGQLGETDQSIGVWRVEWDSCAIDPFVTRLDDGSQRQLRFSELIEALVIEFVFEALSRGRLPEKIFARSAEFAAQLNFGVLAYCFDSSDYEGLEQLRQLNLVSESDPEAWSIYCGQDFYLWSGNFYSFWIALNSNSFEALRSNADVSPEFGTEIVIGPLAHDQLKDNSSSYAQLVRMIRRQLLQDVDLDRDSFMAGIIGDEWHFRCTLEMFNLPSFDTLIHELLRTKNLTLRWRVETEEGTVQDWQTMKLSEH